MGGIPQFYFLFKPTSQTLFSFPVKGIPFFCAKYFGTSGSRSRLRICGGYNGWNKEKTTC
jgi:hypothetical protein